MSNFFSPQGGYVAPAGNTNDMFNDEFFPISRYAAYDNAPSSFLGGGQNATMAGSNLIPSTYQPGAQPPASGGPFGTGWGTMQGWGAAAQGAAQIFGAVNALNQNKQARRQFDFTKNAYNAQIREQAKLTNDRLRRHQRIRNSFSGQFRAPVQVDGSAIA